MSCPRRGSMDPLLIGTGMQVLPREALPERVGAKRLPISILEKDRSCLSQVELDFESKPHFDGPTITDSGPESHLICGPDGLFIQSVRQPAHDANGLYYAIRTNQHPCLHDSLNPLFARFLGIVWSRMVQR